MVEETLDIEDYGWFEIVDACGSFGYDAKTVDKWITMGEEIPLILECIFELN
jgi:3-oxoacyl-[acyl-carrier-protein] synthase III